MTTLEVLKAARAKIEKGWTQGTMARDKNGVAVSSDDKDATCWCALGAVLAVRREEWVNAVPFVRDAVGGGELLVWNDTPGRTQAEVLAAFDKAIELCEKEAANG